MDRAESVIDNVAAKYAAVILWDLDLYWGEVVNPSTHIERATLPDAVAMLVVSGVRVWADGEETRTKSFPLPVGLEISVARVVQQNLDVRSRLMNHET